MIQRPLLIKGCQNRILVSEITQTSFLELFPRVFPIRIMSPCQILSKHPDTPEGSSNTYSTNESRTGFKDQPLKKFSSDDQFHRNLIALGWRFLLTFFSLVHLAVSLWFFSQSQSLSKWEQRSFNMLSILFSGSASLGLGSLIGHLGSMLRWPLLARTIYRMQDVW